MERYEKTLKSAREYLEMAEAKYGELLTEDNPVWNPVISNCIMSMIKSVDTLMLVKRDKSNSDHSKTANELKKMYENGLISDSFKSNVDTVKKWVVNSKTDVQYRDKDFSQTEVERCIKGTKRLIEKVEKEIE